LSPASSSPWTAGSWPIRGFSGEASSTFFCGCKKRRLKAEGTAWPFAKDTRPGEGTRRNGRPGSGMGQQGDLTVIGRCRSAADAGEHRSGLLLVRHTGPVSAHRPERAGSPSVGRERRLHLHGRMRRRGREPVKGEASGSSAVQEARFAFRVRSPCPSGTASKAFSFPGFPIAGRGTEAFPAALIGTTTF
jgi:hypothetical protein